jgi:hypothetical protein
MSVLLKKEFWGLIFLLCAAACQTIPTSEYSGSMKDLGLIASIKGDGEQHVSDRSILWVEKGYLSKNQAITLQRKIDQGIGEIENFTGLKYDPAVYKKVRIEYFAHTRPEASHTITGYDPRKYMSPVIFLRFAAEGKAPYIHEAVHIIAWDWYALWMKEGLAVFLNDKLHGDPAYPNFGKNLDRFSRNNLDRRQPLSLIGQNGVPVFADQVERRFFYIFSGSFVKYLYTHIGIEKLMKIYTAKDTRKAIAEITGRNMNLWKKDWIASLKKE